MELIFKTQHGLKHKTRREKIHFTCLTKFIFVQFRSICTFFLRTIDADMGSINKKLFLGLPSLINNHVWYVYPTVSTNTTVELNKYIITLLKIVFP